MWVAKWYNLSVYQGIFYVNRDEEDRVCIGDNAKRNYISNNIKPMINRNNIESLW